VIDLLATLATQANAANIPVSVCGEAASRPLEALVLAGLGIGALSMPPSAILPIKAMLAETDLAKLREFLDAVRKTADGAASLRKPIAAWTREHGLPI
jgi:phosphotransferase system enzyme I (PtsP)